jgi:hypothetical protein
MQEHVRHIRYTEIHGRYVGHRIQNELIELMGSEVKKHILRKVKATKYFGSRSWLYSKRQSERANTPCFLDATDSEVELKEHILEIVHVEDWIGRGLADTWRIGLTDLHL